MNIEFNRVTPLSQFVAIVLFVGVFVLGFYLGIRYEKEQYELSDARANAEKVLLGSDVKNATYIIEGVPVTLKEGVSEMGGISTRYFGNEVKADFDKDGKEDIAFLFTHTGGGSGTFYYVATALGRDNGVIGTNAIFLGDRIAPQTTEFRDGEIIVNFAIRAEGEPMTASPSIGVSKYFTILDGELVAH